MKRILIGRPVSIVFVLLMVSLTAPLHADFLVLKKKILVGEFRQATETEYLFKTDAGERSIPRYEVSRLVIGFDGIPVCFQTKRSQTPNCKGTLFLLDGVRAVLGFPQPGKDEWYKIRMKHSSLSFLKMKKSTLDPALLPVLARGLQVQVQLRDETNYTGEMVRARGNLLELKTPGGERQRIKRGDIQGATILLPGRELKFIPEPPKRKGGWWIFGTLWTMLA